MPTILISGAASGLGAAFVETYRTQPSTTIIAIDKTPFKSHHPNIQCYEVDITSETSIRNFTSTLALPQSLDLLIHSAGIRGLNPAIECKTTDITACESLSATTLATLLHTFTTNTAGTFLLLRALPTKKAIIMSSRMGSLTMNSAGGGYAYRASKAALNAIVRSMAVDVPETTFVLCHPGRVESGLVKWREEGAISAQESVEGLVPLIEGWGEEDSGKFYDRFGVVIPW